MIYLIKEICISVPGDNFISINAKARTCSRNSFTRNTVSSIISIQLPSSSLKHNPLVGSSIHTYLHNRLSHGLFIPREDMRIFLFERVLNLVAILETRTQFPHRSSSSLSSSRKSPEWSLALELGAWLS